MSPTTSFSNSWSPTSVFDRKPPVFAAYNANMYSTYYKLAQMRSTAIHTHKHKLTHKHAWMCVSMREGQEVNLTRYWCLKLGFASENRYLGDRLSEA